MANRSYLYTANLVPGPGVPDGALRLVAVSEWNYDIPAVYKLLLSGAPRACRSSIFTHDHDIAVAGDFQQGVAALRTFLGRLPHPEARELLGEAEDFLLRERRVQPYFVLECAEIFDLSHEPIERQNARLLDELRDRDALTAAMKARLSADLAVMPVEAGSGSGFFARLFRRPARPSPESVTQALTGLGLRRWHEVLYYSFDDPADAAGGRR